MFSVSLLSIWLLLAHPHPPPVTCMQWCRDANCNCFEKCKANGHFPPSGCTKACNEDFDRCENSCRGGKT